MIPRYVALCGSPHVGKTEVAGILAKYFQAEIVDDGLCLRTAAMSLYGLSWDDVSTQDGKDREVTICGANYSVRSLLGELGKQQEKFYGKQFMPERALASIKNANAPLFVFPSCRMNQGNTYINNGGIVVEVRRPGFESYYDFDHYDKSLITLSICNYDNTTKWRYTLTEEVIRTFDDLQKGEFDDLRKGKIVT